MYFCFNEYHSKGKSYNPNILLGYYDDPNDINNKITNITFNDFFEKLSYDILNSMLEELNKILKYSKSDCINQEVWFKYKIAYSLTIPKIGERYIRSFSKINNEIDGKGIEFTYYQNRRPKKLTFENNYDFFKTKPLNLFDGLAKDKNAEYNLLIKKEAICNNSIELLYAFLQCLFNFPQRPYYIRKCKYCNRFYVDTYYKTLYCQRTNLIKNRSVACCNIKSFIKKQNEYKIFLTADKKLQNLIQDNCDYDNYLKYLNERDNVIEECIKTRNLMILKDFIDSSKIKYL